MALSEKGISLWDTALNHAFDDARNRQFGKSRKKWRRFSFAFDKVDFLEIFSEKSYLEFVGKEHDWNKIKDQWSQDKDFLRETWNIALDDEDKFKLILLHAENLFQVRYSWGINRFFTARTPDLSCFLLL